MSHLLIEKESFENLQETLMLLVNEVKSSKKPTDSISLLSVEQISELWDMESQTVRKYLKINKVQPIVFSDKRSIRYRKSDIEKFINSKELQQWKN